MTSRQERDLVIRPARYDDVPAILTLRDEASTWLRERGIEQWTADKTDEITANVTGGWTWVVEDEHTVICSITLRGPDFDFWEAADEPSSGLYIYKAMVARAYAGQDLGGEMLDWAGDLAYRNGYNWLRLDCWRSNTALHRYYERHGFRHVRTVVRSWRQSGALFQRPTAPKLTRLREVVPG